MEREEVIENSPEPNINTERSTNVLIVANFIVLLLTLSTFFGLFYLWKTDQTNSNANANASAGSGALTDITEATINDLVKNLTDNNFVMYGYSSEAKTEDQLKLFGISADKIDFVDCNPASNNSNPEECVARNISFYPTWTNNKNVSVGIKTPEELKKMLDRESNSNTRTW